MKKFFQEPDVMLQKLLAFDIITASAELDEDELPPDMD